ncbi:condensation domain protein [Rhodococcus sp. MTM3W5.2]|uniref:condensation domain-containing protein n=1 Tax=Rhodococcus sp. MTM3W5.2 TaxID=1805827 RepID=UPI00097960EB|nr:condensation domain-containing protein [Rhodococcus sp. MTM3W5.2]AQA21684.1 condensation domain protein [Rhodococcus sp. MTM3W5.2]
MEFTELSDYPISAGTLTEWLPSAPFDDGSSPWFDDPRPASYVHEARLRQATRTTGPEHGSWLGTAFEITGQLDTAALAHALNEWIDRHEALRSHASISPTTGAVSRHTIETGRVRVTARSHGYRTSGAENHADLAELFDGCTSPLSWPSYAFATLVPPGPDDRFTVFLAADHAIIDGLSVVIVAQEIEALYRQARDGIDADLFPVGSYVDFGARERDTAAELDPGHPVVELWRSTLDHCGGALPEFPLDIGAADPGPVPQSGVSAWALDADGADAFTLACRKLGHSFFAGTLACLGIVGAELAGEPRFEAVTPMHTRNDPQLAGSVGWYVGLGPICFDVYGAQSFGELAARAQAQIAAAKPAARYPYERVSEVLTTAAKPRFVVSYMDLRFVPAATQWPEWNARALRSKQYEHDVHIWVNRTPRGVNIAARYPDTGEAAANVHRYLGRLKNLMEEVVGTGTCTLADHITR